MIVHLSLLIRYCGFFSGESKVNNFYNCSHPKVEDSEFDEELKREVGKCLSFGCPVAVKLDEEDGYTEFDDMMRVFDEKVLALINETRLREADKNGC